MELWDVRVQLVKRKEKMRSFGFVEITTACSKPWYGLTKFRESKKGRLSLTERYSALKLHTKTEWDLVFEKTSIWNQFNSKLRNLSYGLKIPTDTVPLNKPQSHIRLLSCPERPLVLSLSGPFRSRDSLILVVAMKLRGSQSRDLPPQTNTSR